MAEGRTYGLVGGSGPKAGVAPPKRRSGSGHPTRPARRSRRDAGSRRGCRCSGPSARSRLFPGSKSGPSRGRGSQSWSRRGAARRPRPRSAGRSGGPPGLARPMARDGRREPCRSGASCRNAGQWVLGKTPKKRRETLEKITNSYDIRSVIVHGPTKRRHRRLSSKHYKRACADGRELACETLSELLERGRFPDWKGLVLDNSAAQLEHS